MKSVSGIYFDFWGPAILLSFSQISLAFDEAFIPPKFPDIFSSFAESLSASDSLRLFVHNLIESNELCGCREAAKVNWTDFNANLGLLMLSGVAQRCPTQTNVNTHEPNVAAVSGGQADKNQPLVIGLSVSVAVVITIVVLFLALKKGHCVRTTWDVMKRKSENLTRPRSESQTTSSPMSKRHQTVVSVSDDVSYNDTSLVSRIGCFSFSGKVKTILLPVKNENREISSKSQDTVIGRYPNRNKTKNLGNGPREHLKISNTGRLSQSSVNQDAKPPVDYDEEITNDDQNFQVESSDDKTSATRPSVNSTVNAGNAKRSVLTNGRQFACDKENLVDHNEVHLFSRASRSQEVKSTKA